jgi:CTP-dependent riboflavin kinase
MRREYWYYRAVAQNGESRENVLVRRAANPIRGRVELFAAVHLGERFGLKAGDSLRVEVVSAAPDASTGA